jgi:hypothetical protein
LATKRKEVSDLMIAAENEFDDEKATKKWAKYETANSDLEAMIDA